MKVANERYEPLVLVRQDEGLTKEQFTEAIETISIAETHAAFKVEAQIPDIFIGNCKVDFKHGILTISGYGIMALELNLIGMANHKHESVHSYRDILPGRWFGSEKIEVTYKDRLFTINIPKKELLQKFVSEFFIV